MFHKYVTKTEEEVKEIRLRREKRKKEKERRKKEQDNNVKRKDEEKRRHKEKSMAGMKKADEPEFTGKEKKAIREFQGEQAKDSDDDEDWYRKEVGAEPEAELFSKSNKGGQGQTRTIMKGRFSKKPQSAEDNRERGGASGGGAGRGSRGRNPAGGPGSSRSRAVAGGDRDGSKHRGEKRKRSKNVFNSEGIGPNFRRDRGGNA